jgi:hypothetical protein
VNRCIILPCQQILPTIAHVVATIVLCCPTIVSPARLVYFDHNPAGSWVIRDFLAGFKLSNETSPLTVADVEQDAIHSERPPWCNVEIASMDWRLYLELRTTVYTEQRNRNVDVQHPIDQAGQWRPL